jgi:uncharacterized protein YegJ (DUF2314 family)
MYKPILLSALYLVILVLVLTGCGSATPTVASDEEFEAAVKEAHETMDTVRQAILAPDPSYRFVGLKVRFTGGEVAFEDHWTEPVDFYSDIFTIRLLEGLTLDLGLHPNQLVDVNLKDVLDWVIVESDGRLVGGYTIKLAYRHMTPDEKKKFLQITGYVID